MQIRPISVPADVVESTVDYRSAFELSGIDAGARTAEEWARAIFEGAPTPIRRILYVSWSVGLRLDLGPAEATTHVLGWVIAAATTDSITLSAESRYLAAENIVTTTADSVTWTTTVRYANGLGKALWALAAPIHRVTIRRLLRRAGSGIS